MGQSTDLYAKNHFWVALPCGRIELGEWCQGCALWCVPGHKDTLLPPDAVRVMDARWPPDQTAGSKQRPRW